MEGYNPIARFWGKSSRDAYSGEGAIDIVAIRKADSSLLCTPFHVRLPPLLRKNNGSSSSGSGNSSSSSNIVRLKVNGREVKVRMKLGPLGEAFFVEKTSRPSPPKPPFAPLEGAAMDVAKRTAQENAAKESPTSAAIRIRSLSANDIDELACKHNSSCSDESRTTFESALSTTAIKAPPSPTRNRKGALPDAQRSRSNTTSHPGDAAALLAGEGASADSKGPSAAPAPAWTWVWGDLPKRRKGALCRSSSALHDLTSDAASPSPLLHTPSPSPRLSPRKEGGLHLLRRFSLCGHVLSEETGAPEPAPVTSSDLRALLASYSIPDSSVEAVLEDANLVVAIDDYLLNTQMLRSLLQFYNNNDTTDVSRAINSLPIMTAETVNACSAAAVAKAPLPRWAGKQISSWSYERLLHGQIPEFQRALSADSDFFFGYSSPVSASASAGADERGTGASAGSQRITSPVMLVAPGPLHLPDMDSLLSLYSVPVSVPGLELASSPLQQQSLMLGSDFSFYSSDTGADGAIASLVGRIVSTDATDQLEDIPFDEICPDPAPSDFNDSDTDSFISLSLGESGYEAEPRQTYRYRRTLVPSEQQLQSLGLQDGANELRFESGDGRSLTAQLFVWPHDAKIVVVDIEGVLLSAKPAPRGVWSSFLAPNTSRAVAQPAALRFFWSLEQSGYRILYLAQGASRSSGKECLAALAGAEPGSPQAPAGPVFQSPERLVRELGAARAELFKAAALRGVRGLYSASGHQSPYYASFGHRECDMLAYSRCGVPEGRIYSVDEQGRIRGLRRTLQKTFTDFSADLGDLFPPCADSQSRRERYGDVHDKSMDESYNDFNFWKIPMRTID